MSKENKIKTVPMRLTTEEVRLIHQSLNEVCYGLQIGDFKGSIGDKAQAETEINRLRRVYDDAEQKNHSSVQLSINGEQAALYKNSLEKVISEIEDWEFGTRMGATRQDAAALENKFSVDI